MDESKLPTQKEHIIINGDDLSKIKLIKERTYEKTIVGSPNIPNKLAGRPFWEFEYKDITFTTSFPNFLKELNNANLHQVIISFNKSKYLDSYFYNIYTYSTISALAKLKEFEAKREKRKAKKDKMKRILNSLKKIK